MSPLNFKRRTNFVLSKELLKTILWAKALDGKGFQERWLILKHLLLLAQKKHIPALKKNPNN